MHDIFDNGTPKYQEIVSIYEGLRAMASGEEIGVLSEMFPDISWEGQEYYYTDEGSKLLEAFESLSHWGNDFLRLEVANAYVLTEYDYYDLPRFVNLCPFMADFLRSPKEGLAKQIKFKSVFLKSIEYIDKSNFDRVCDLLFEEIREEGSIDYRSLSSIFTKVLRDNNLFTCTGAFVDLNVLLNNLRKNLDKLNLNREKELIIKSRAMLTSYDDFIFGLKINQTMYNELEKMYCNRVAELESKCSMLMSIIEKNGLMLDSGAKKQFVISENLEKIR